MEKVLTHKGYTGSIEVSLEDDCLHGRVLFVNDLITYEGPTPAGLEKTFKKAVDRYLEHCRTIGKKPDKACSGNLNVRLGPDLHRKAATKAVQEGRTLNDLIARAVEASIDPPAPHLVVHEHIVVEEIRPLGVRVAGGSSNESAIRWERYGATH